MSSEIVQSFKKGFFLELYSKCSATISEVFGSIENVPMFSEVVPSFKKNIFFWNSILNVPQVFLKYSEVFRKIPVSSTASPHNFNIMSPMYQKPYLYKFR